MTRVGIIFSVRCQNKDWNSIALPLEVEVLYLGVGECVWERWRGVGWRQGWGQDTSVWDAVLCLLVCSIAICIRHSNPFNPDPCNAVTSCAIDAFMHHFIYFFSDKLVYSVSMSPVPQRMLKYHHKLIRCMPVDFSWRKGLTWPL